MCVYIYFFIRPILCFVEFRFLSADYSFQCVVIFYWRSNDCLILPGISNSVNNSKETRQTKYSLLSSSSDVWYFFSSSILYSYGRPSTLMSVLTVKSSLIFMLNFPIIPPLNVYMFICVTNHCECKHTKNYTHKVIRYMENVRTH